MFLLLCAGVIGMAIAAPSGEHVHMAKTLKGRNMDLKILFGSLFGTYMVVNVEFNKVAVCTLDET